MKLSELVESSVDHRELGMKDEIHSSARPTLKVGEYADFYNKKGDKTYGKVICKNNTHVSFEVKGKTHRQKFV